MSSDPTLGEHDITDDISLTKQNKENTSEVAYQKEFFRIKENFSNHYAVFTDDSKLEEKVAAYFPEHPDSSKATRLRDGASVFSAELEGIALALTEIKKLTKHHKNFVIYSDSLSALQAIQSKNFKVIDIRRLYNLIRKFPPYVRISFVWIPAHVGIQGNENVDKLAKAALDRTSTSGKLICNSDLKPKINSYIKSVWQRDWDAEGANKLHEVLPNLGKDLHRRGEGAGRKLETTMCRLRVGHTWLTQSYLLKNEQQPFCYACDSLYTVRHILIECPDFQDTRRKYFSVTDLYRLFRETQILRLADLTGYTLRTILAIAGEDYALIATDTRLSQGFSIHSRDSPKTYPLSQKTVLGCCGFHGDVLTLTKVLNARLQIFEKDHNKPMPTPSVAAMLSTMLYYRRFFPYYTHNLVVGLDEEGKGCVYSFDPVGSYEREVFRAKGSASAMLQPLLDNQSAAQGVPLVGLRGGRGALELNPETLLMTQKKTPSDPSPQPDVAKEPCREAARGAASVASKRKVEDLPSLMNMSPFAGWSLFKKFMVISSKGSAKVADRSPFKIHRELKSILADETIEVTKLGSGDLMFELKANEQPKKLGAITTFLDIPVTVSPHKSLNSSKIVIRSCDLRCCSEEELSGITHAQRITMHRGEDKIQTDTVALTFDSPKPPSRIHAGYLTLDVRPYILLPMHCYKCQCYGYGKDRCKKPAAVCVRCGKGGHVERDCSD
ncbi:proteasome subunit beta type [Plakobranchus ocellatus]|uniref:Proteasome subunit beta type n=1 Tax=Plakobranchus ocellatus TaxID=259542 RepID=A0AAV4DZP2_9GAST|nr:proteasome subunit beta type [Plakobranchus ocellatus]